MREKVRTKLAMARVTKSLGLGITLLVACAAHSFVRADDLNDYPTSARVDYVFACMKAPTAISAFA